MDYIPYYLRKQLVVAYDEMILEKIDEGWQPHFISFMFNRSLESQQEKRRSWKMRFTGSIQS